MLTNKQLVKRLYNFYGPLRAEIRSSLGTSLSVIRKGVLISLMKSDGLTRPARCNLRVRKGVGYIVPLDKAA